MGRSWAWKGHEMPRGEGREWGWKDQGRHAGGNTNIQSWLGRKSRGSIGTGRQKGSMSRREALRSQAQKKVGSEQWPVDFKIGRWPVALRLDTWIKEIALNLAAGEGKSIVSNPHAPTNGKNCIPALQFKWNDTLWKTVPGFKRCHICPNAGRPPIQDDPPYFPSGRTLPLRRVFGKHKYIIFRNAMKLSNDYLYCLPMKLHHLI